MNGMRLSTDDVAAAQRDGADDYRFVYFGPAGK
jgi:hypothetical protein